MNTHPSYILWDWNGTLLNDAWLCIDIMNQSLIKRNLPTLTTETYPQYFDFPVKIYYERLGFDFAHEPFEEVGLEFMHGYQARIAELSLQPNAEIVLQRCKKAGIIQSMLSAMENSLLNQLVQRFRIASFFETVQGIANHYAYGKITLVQNWINQQGIDCTTLMLVGDTTHDAKVARNVGCKAILIPSGHHPHDKLQQTGFPVLSSLDEVPFFLDV